MSTSSTPKNIALKIAYDGSTYYGWQMTTAGPSIEEQLSLCLQQILQEQITLQAASRTDRGVHAEGQIVNFLTFRSYPLEKLKLGLNALLPSSIRVIKIQEMPYAFHPTLHAERKEYHYHICSPFQFPLRRYFSWHVPSPLNLEQMREAAAHFIGEHDFTSFCNARKNLNYVHRRRFIEAIEFNCFPDQLSIAIKGNHFLYKMVRNIVGTLVYVGLGKIAAVAIPAILQQKRRPEAGITAPAHGLSLKEIYYPQEYVI